jgi:hypothetical protein
MNFYELLSVNGRPPRRAVLVDGRIADKTSHPTEPEIDLLSRLCELTRPGGPPRHTTALMENALVTNSPECWAAACDDIKTGDFDAAAFASLLAQNQSNPAAFAACLATATDANHLVHVVRVFHAVVMTPESREIFGRTLGCQLKSLVDVLAVHGGLLKKDIRDAVTGEIGKLLAAAEVPDVQLAEVLQAVVTQKKYDALRLFLHAPRCFRLRPGLLTTLIERAKNVPIQHRASVLTVIAKALSEDPDAVIENMNAVRDLVGTLSRASMDDVRALLAMAVMAGISFEDDVVRGLSVALEWTAAHILSNV